MPRDNPPTEPLADGEKFKPKKVRDGDKADPKLRRGKGPDTPQGAENHLQMKSMNRQ